MLPHDMYQWLLPTFLIAYLILAVMCFVYSYSSQYTKEVMVYGWTPVVASMFLSNLSGPISEASIKRFPTFARFQVVMNGAGGNLGAIFCCKLSTKLLVAEDELRLKNRAPSLPSPYLGLKKRLSRMGSFSGPRPG